MALSMFDDEAGPPDARELATGLGGANALWDELVRHVCDKYPPVTQV
jgi:hypothetical protein